LPGPMNLRMILSIPASGHMISVIGVGEMEKNSIIQKGDLRNARLENGSLVIEAHKNPLDGKWSSARLTTRGKVSFLYGKIEFRAKVPPFKGNWAAGWTLGNDYVDEMSWPILRRN
jgi:hypothetical protein